MKPKEKCYLCGAIENLTRDHVPPKSIFAPGTPNLITVPCCSKCNESNSMDDESFRNWVSAVHSPSVVRREIFTKKVLNGCYVKKPHLLRQAQASFAFRKLSKEYPPVPTLTFPSERGDRILKRISKGLLTHHFPEYDYSND